MRTQHKYEEAINVERGYVKTGEFCLLWGLIRFPTGYYTEHITHLHVCKHCGKTADEYFWSDDKELIHYHFKQ